ncbi:hypothetical protein DAETH_42020 (plasmid) [Deinococcus aetherius]|uniref:Uncharacterized protein n=1 Tax=Deinococcus aetherius TaxID=200252 RepID=A0ABN6RLQ5_9DEIO|nr:hypothetical protein DAETH_42020 [Deinococcus aetherius]
MARIQPSLTHKHGEAGVEGGHALNLAPGGVAGTQALLSFRKDKPPSTDIRDRERTGDFRGGELPGAVLKRLGASSKDFSEA